MRDDREKGVVGSDGRIAEDLPKWRRDFPVDVPEDQYVARRDFTRFMVLTSFAFAVGQFWIALKSRFTRRKPPARTKIAGAAQLEPGQAMAFNYPGKHDACLLVRTADGSLHAYDQKCTHLSCAVQPEMKEGRLRCPCHEGYFDLATGRPLAGPPRRPLTRITLDVEGAEVYATGVREET